MPSLSLDYILASFLIFVRVGSLIMTAPFFNTSSFPNQVKLYFALVTSVILSFVIPADSIVIPINSGLPFIVIAIILEVLVGVAMGLVGQLIFAGIEMAGQLISLKITLSFAQIIDATSQKRTDLVGNLFNMVAIWVFLVIGGDKMYINALVRSFELIPIAHAHLQQTGPFMLEVAKYLFIVAVQVSAPFLVVLFLLDLALAIFARIMPQANIMFISIPIKLLLGFFLLAWIFPYLPQAFRMIFDHLFKYLTEVLQIISP